MPVSHFEVHPSEMGKTLQAGHAVNLQPQLGMWFCLVHPSKHLQRMLPNRLAHLLLPQRVQNLSIPHFLPIPAHQICATPLRLITPHRRVLSGAPPQREHARTPVEEIPLPTLLRAHCHRRQHRLRHRPQDLHEHAAVIQDARLDEAGVDVHKGRAWVLLGELLAGEVVHDDGMT